jgi:hypothetical protein
MFHDLHVDEFTTGRSHMVVFIIVYDMREFTTGRSHMVVFIIVYDMRVNFLYAM